MMELSDIQRTDKQEVKKDHTKQREESRQRLGYLILALCLSSYHLIPGENDSTNIHHLLVFTYLDGREELVVFFGLLSMLLRLLLNNLRLLLSNSGHLNERNAHRRSRRSH